MRHLQRSKLRLKSGLFERLALAPLCLPTLAMRRQGIAFRLTRGLEAHLIIVQALHRDAATPCIRRVTLPLLFARDALRVMTMGRTLRIGVVGGLPAIFLEPRKNLLLGQILHSPPSLLKIAQTSLYRTCLLVIIIVMMIVILISGWSTYWVRGNVNV